MKLVITAPILKIVFFINLLIGRRPQTTKTTGSNPAGAGGSSCIHNILDLIKLIIFLNLPSMTSFWFILIIKSFFFTGIK